MARLKRHIIQKYNNALCTVIEYYALPVNRQYSKQFNGILYLDLSKLKIGFDTRDNFDRLHEDYVYLVPFVKFQHHYIDGHINENVCVDYLLEINEVLKKIKGT